MSSALALALALPWGAASAWLWLRGTRRAVKAAVRGGRSHVWLRLVGVALLVFVPALVAPVAIVGSLLGFVLGRNVLVFREIGGARARG